MEGQKVGQEQIHGLLFGERLSWKAIIYDLINTEQLDPWDIDLSVLVEKYLEKVRKIEEANFFVSSKVLLAASLLLRIKSEILLNRDLKSLDDILFAREEGKKYIQERIEFDEEVPDLVPRSPLPRNRKVTLQELMSALGKAITTENRRIKKVVVLRQHELETSIALPKATINIKDRIREVYSKIRNAFSKRNERMAFSELVVTNERNDKIGYFVPLLHLDNQHKVVLDQEAHLDEIWIWTKELHNKKHAALLEVLRKEAEIEFEKERLENEKYDGEDINTKTD